MPLRVVSYGGGVQSTALLVLAARGAIDFPIFLFANVGDDSEHPATLRYVAEVARPYAAAHGIELHEVQRLRRDGTPETLLDRLHRSKRSITIPVRMPAPLGFMRRNCTQDFKVRTIEKWLKQHGASAECPAVTAIGISHDEAHRANSRKESPVQQKVYPLLELRMDRNDCRTVIAAAGLPVPPKSSCWFCPYHTNGTWQTMREREPILFEKYVAIERMLSDRLKELQGRPAYFHNRLKPLPMATTANRQGELFEDSPLEVCESGYCMT